MVIQRIATISTLVARARGTARGADAGPCRRRSRARRREAARAAARVRGPTSTCLCRRCRRFVPFEPEALYEQAREAIENSQFDRALRELDRSSVRRTAGPTRRCTGRPTASPSWRSSKEALETIKEMAKQFAASPWVKDAKALELEIRQAAGQPISADLQSDEELKLLALRGVMQTDPDKGLPIIEKMLAGGAAPRVRDRALFVLSQSRSPKARDIMVTTAKNNANPELQLRAIRYLGMHGRRRRSRPAPRHLPRPARTHR